MLAIAQEQSRQQKKKIQELHSELSRLQELEAQSRDYQKRSPESLEVELKLHQKEIADLSSTMQDAAKQEADWVRSAWRVLFLLLMALC